MSIAARRIYPFIMFGIGAYLAVSAAISLINTNKAIEEERIAIEQEKIAKQELALAEEDLAYEYGKCVFYDRASVEECNTAAPHGFAMYEKYYGDGSWTAQADPTP